MSAAADSINAPLYGQDAEFFGVSIDSRKINDKQLFLALKGPNHDAHNYVEQAEKNGAVGFIVNQQVNVDQPQIVVKDTYIALASLAVKWRQKLKQTKVIGVTGSNGKTTVKEMLSTVLSLSGKTAATKGNLNNDIGMPLTLLNIGQENQYAVIEMGANHANEIDYLANIAKPHVALVNNAGPAHLEGFGGIEGVAKAKGEIYQHLTDDGVAIINLDDDYADYWLKLNKTNRVLTFSLGNKKADVVGDKRNSSLYISYQKQDIAVNLPLPGEHNARNALAVSAVCMALEVDLLIVKQGLESMQAVAGRLKTTTLSAGNLLIDDAYNSNPMSYKAAIDVLSDYQKTRCLIMADMAELGESAPVEHKRIGLYAKDKKIDQLYCYGQLSQHAAQAFGQQVASFDSKAELIAYLKKVNSKDTVFLVKGSRSMAMEEVVEFLTNHFDRAGN